MTSSQYGLYALGYTRVTMVDYKGLPTREGELISKKQASVQIGVCNSTP